MFEKVGRKIYSDLRERVRTAIGETLREHKITLAEAVQQEFGRKGARTSGEHVQEFLDEVVGEAITAVAEDVFEDLEAIADAMLEKKAAEEVAVPPAAKVKAEEEEEAEEEVEDEEVEEAEGEEEVEEAPAEEAKKASTQLIREINAVRAKALALSKRVAKVDPDAAAALRMAAKDL